MADWRQQRPSGGGGGGGGEGGGGGGPKSQQQQHQQVPPYSQQQHQSTNQTQQLIADPQSEGFNAKHGYGGRGYQVGQQGRGHHHGYSQNRRWQQQHRQPGQRNAKETDSVKEDKNEYKTFRVTDNAGGDDHKNDGKREGGKKVSLLQSSKERLRRRLNEKEEVPVATPGPQRNRMDKLLEILNSMRSNSSGVEAQLTSFMEEAQSSAQSEETLNEIVHTIYGKAVRDRGFAATAAKLCYKMALFMVEGTKFRSLLLNMLQECFISFCDSPQQQESSARNRGECKSERDFTRREELQQTDVESWLGFITFLCEVFSTMRSSTGEPFRVLVCPIYTCLREALIVGERQAAAGPALTKSCLYQYLSAFPAQHSALCWSRRRSRKMPCSAARWRRKEGEEMRRQVIRGEEEKKRQEKSGKEKRGEEEKRQEKRGEERRRQVRRGEEEKKRQEKRGKEKRGEEERGKEKTGEKRRGGEEKTGEERRGGEEKTGEERKGEDSSLQSAGRLLEEQLPEMMMELLAAVRDKMLSPAESPLTRSLLMEVIELHAHQWSPLEALTTQYYNRTIQKLTA
ncbi:hypothetical protein QTP70_024239 [Hemibagrus guttatus]|uniref:MIF4G domain-containing protein n=1 Tax=Hemibagrus guttatus TaxID=175788 RepID=A0AAE0QL77_9TELE|nr:hypothetical protein QTP70_024239 [Hemibagrus guttatus]